MKKLLLILLLPITAYAGGYKPQEPVKMEIDNNATAIAVGKSSASSKSVSGAVALGGSSKAIAGDSTATNHLSDFGNSSVSNVNNVGVDLAGAVTVGGPTIEGDTLNAGDISNIVEGHDLSTGDTYQVLEYRQAREFVQYQAPAAYHTIGETSIAADSCGGNLGVVSERGRSESAIGATGGCNWFFGAPKDALVKAQRVQDFKLRDAEYRLYAFQVNFEADMVLRCEELHENYEYRGVLLDYPDNYGELNFDSPEFGRLSRSSLALWKKCQQSGHYDEHGPKRHNQDKNPLQFSPTVRHP